jgi:hypothetical protein
MPKGDEDKQPFPAEQGMEQRAPKEHTIQQAMETHHMEFLEVSSIASLPMMR